MAADIKRGVADQILGRLDKLDESIQDVKRQLHRLVKTERHHAQQEERRDEIMAQELDELIQEVSENQDALDSMGLVLDQSNALLGELKKDLDAAIASGDPQQLRNLSAKLNAQQTQVESKKAEVLAAIAANTPLENPSPPTLLGKK